MWKRKKHQINSKYKKTKLEKKEAREKWIDENWRYLLEGWGVIFILVIITFAIACVNLHDKFDLNAFLKLVSYTGLIMFPILDIGFLFLMVNSKTKMGFLYLCSTLGGEAYLLIALLEYKNKIFILFAVIMDLFIAAVYTSLRIDKQIEDKKLSISFNNLSSMLSILIPAFATIVSSLLRK